MYKTFRSNISTYVQFPQTCEIKFLILLYSLKDFEFGPAPNYDLG